MNFLILGSGALGSYFGGRLKLNGCSVTLVVKNTEHLDIIRSDGLTLKTDNTIEKTRIHCISTKTVNQLNNVYDAIFTFTKSKDTHNALSTVRHLIQDHSVLITLQNGIGNEMILNQFSKRVIYGCTTLPADLEKPGTVRSSGSHETIFYPLQTKDLVIANNILYLLNKSGIPSQLNEDISIDIWRKAIFNSAVNVICALIRGCPREIAKSKSLINLARMVNSSNI